MYTKMLCLAENAHKKRNTNYSNGLLKNNQHGYILHTWLYPNSARLSKYTQRCQLPGVFYAEVYTQKNIVKENIFKNK